MLAQQCEINMGINNDNLEMAKLYESKIGIFIRKLTSVKRKIARKIKKILGII